MSLTLHPQASFTVVRQIANHLDTDTLYVKAVIRNAYTDAIIETLELTSRGSQRFSKNWRVPADPSGMGFYVSIVTSVYSDSGYTTKSGNYGDEENTYLVQDRVPMGGRGGGGGIDARTVRRIIQEELDKAKPEAVEEIPEAEKPKTPKMRWDEILSGISELKAAVAKVPTDRPDLSTVTTLINQAIAAITSKEVTPVTDIEPIVSRLEALSTYLTNFTDDEKMEREDLKGFLKSLEETLTTKIEETVGEAIDSTEFVTTQTTMPAKRHRAKEEEREQFDVTKMAI